MSKISDPVAYCTHHKGDGWDYNYASNSYIYAVSDTTFGTSNDGDYIKQSLYWREQICVINHKYYHTTISYSTIPQCKPPKVLDEKTATCVIPVPTCTDSQFLDENNTCQEKTLPDNFPDSSKKVNYYELRRKLKPNT